MELGQVGYVFTQTYQTIKNSMSLLKNVFSLKKLDQFTFV